MTTIARSPLALRRWPAAALAALIAIGGAGWYAAAQLAPGDRGVPPVDSTSNLEVTGVHVDVYGKTAEEARQAGWREAQRKGWKMLWARMHGTSPEAAPGLPDSTLDSIVSGIEIEQEQQGPHRYIATLGVQFDRARAGPMVGSQGAIHRSAPMLVIPIQFEGGFAESFEQRTDWQKAWARFRAGTSPVDYVRPVGSGPDPLLLNLGQARRPGRIWWRMLLDQYGASDIVIPEVHLTRGYPGGPIKARFVARHGPDGEVLGSFTGTAPTSQALDDLLDKGVKRIDEIYVRALSDGDLRPDPSLTIEEPVETPTADLLPLNAENPLDAIVANVSNAAAATLTVQVETPDAAALDSAETALRSVPGVASQRVASLALGGITLIDVSFAGDPATLKQALAARGWRLEGSGGSFRMRRAAPSAPPAAPSALESGKPAARPAAPPPAGAKQPKP